MQVSTSNAIYAKTKNGLLEITRPSTNAEMPELLQIVKPSFRLNSDTDGLTMLSALKSLYKHKRRHRDRFEPHMIQKDRTWYFIFGTFFKKFSGVVMETDVNGKINSIKWGLGIPRQMSSPSPTSQKKKSIQSIRQMPSTSPNLSLFNIRC